jgi:hypothetical protein
VKGRRIGRYVVATSLIVVLGVPAVAIGFGEGRPLDGGQRNPSRSAFTKETEIISRNDTYSTRQSNIQNGDGGGAIYGCRSNAGQEPCLRGNNLTNGRAFEFATNGNEGGLIQVGNPAGAPFQTNATGLVKNLNAEKLNGNSASDFAATTSLLFAIVQANGQATGKGVTNSSSAGTNYTLTFNRDVSNCSFTASPVGGSVDETPGVNPGSGANANQVTVDMGATRAFHLQVMCA